MAWWVERREWTCKDLSSDPLGPCKADCGSMHLIAELLWQNGNPQKLVCWLAHHALHWIIEVLLS